LKEDQQLVEDLRVAFSQDIAELEVSFLSDFFCCFEDYLLNKLSAADYAYFESRFEKFKQIWGKYIYKNHILDCAADFSLLNDYYAVNTRRNEVFLNTVLCHSGGQTVSQCRHSGGSRKPVPYDFLKCISCRPLNRIPASAGMTTSESHSAMTQGVRENRDVIVAVTGGFHTAGLTKLLEEKNISYLTITPAITRTTRESTETYEKIARQQAKLFDVQAQRSTHCQWGKDSFSRRSSG
jgi:hypothetical protein